MRNIDLTEATKEVRVQDRVSETETSLIIAELEKPAKRARVVLEGPPAPLCKGDKRHRRTLAVGLGNQHIFGLFEFAQMSRKIPRGHRQQLLEPGKGDLIVVA